MKGESASLAVTSHSRYAREWIHASSSSTFLAQSHAALPLKGSIPSTSSSSYDGLIESLEPSTANSISQDAVGHVCRPPPSPLLRSSLPFTDSWPSQLLTA